ncbi:hypothetical protein I0P11_13710 [Acinetobacter baumannii]|uniref:hypothetical protein n=1 Tax=Acinetobacter baumannii TaxID=470 RepID=UPI000616EEB4|nr:hypothetical protein [Acinetobacter baumannii]MBF9262168.1 hypothetical protein [Acinetobacter baumannii]MCZ3070299.1 hypothetical protein [Acinetobacter baumannii]MDC5069324.1 hypothetical protein [Acinetobacter baumannii]MDQ8879814.1 hypothetical protein [Acinetobacter baumannii]MDQ8890847.1 hypothetical protein [Acinetobacter baumannii]
MRYAARRKQDISVSTTPLEVVIPLEQPVKIYTAKELAAMPLSVMNAAIEAQERFYQLEELTHMGGQAIAVRRLMEDGHKLIQVKEKSRTRYKINNEFIPPRIIRQLAMRGLVKLGAVTDV